MTDDLLLNQCLSLTHSGFFPLLFLPLYVDTFLFSYTFLIPLLFAVIIFSFLVD